MAAAAAWHALALCALAAAWAALEAAYGTGGRAAPPQGAREAAELGRTLLRIAAAGIAAHLAGVAAECAAGVQAGGGGDEAG